MLGLMREGEGKKKKTEKLQEEQQISLVESSSHPPSCLVSCLTVLSCRSAPTYNRVSC